MRAPLVRHDKTGAYRTFDSTMFNNFFKLISLLIVSSTFALIAHAQASSSEVSVDEKSQQIIDQAVKAMGGQAYLNINTVIGKGFFTSYAQGMSQIPAKFLDYIVYPDRERTEFTGGGIRTIQTNVADKGWVFDGAVKTIKDQGQPQIDEFKRAMRTSLENLLRGWWKKEGGKLVYVGRREAGLAKRNETIRLTFPSGFWIEYEFGAKDYLPSKMIFKRTRKNPDSGDEEETNEEDRFLKYITMDGVNAPWVIDHYVNGVQSSRVNYESIQYNQKIPDSLFAKPATVKEIK